MMNNTFGPVLDKTDRCYHIELSPEFAGAVVVKGKPGKLSFQEWPDYKFEKLI
jgi:hypothetical protein